MSKDTTNKLCEVLGDRAAKNLRATLDQAALDFHKAIGLSGTSTTVMFTTPANTVTPAEKSSNTEMVEVRVSSRTLIDAVVNTLTRHREQKYRDQAVIDFMKDVASFRSRVNELEQYAQELQYHED